jgi:hypothetical protein
VAVRTHAHPTIALLCLILATCEPGPTGARSLPPESIALVSGDGQSAVVGQELPQPLVVRVLAADSSGVAGVIVSWAVASGDGQLADSASTTDDQGLARMRWTLGTVAGAGNDVATARVVGLTGSPVTFTASAHAGAAARIGLVGGHGQVDAAGAVLPVPYAVRVVDAQGNPVPGRFVTWMVTGGGGSITPYSATDSAGIARALRVLGTTPGLATAAAVAGGLTGSPVAFFATVTAAPATQLAFTVQPTNTLVGFPIAPAVQVTARDQFGNIDSTFAGTVTLAIGDNPPGDGVLDGTASAVAVAGVATFAGLDIDEAGAGYTLTASASGLTGDTSGAFTVTMPGTATELVFTVQPSTGPGGTPINPAIQVTARDALGNRATSFTGDVTLAIGANPGGGTLMGTTTRAAIAGVATFDDIRITRVGAGYTLTASATGLAGDTSAAFNVSTYPAMLMTFTVQPSNTLAGTIITPAVQVALRDALGNVYPFYTGPITVGIGTNPGGGTLRGTTTRNAVAGVATFDDLSIDHMGTGYTLIAVAPGLTGATSAAFSVVGIVDPVLMFDVQPNGTVAGAVIAPAVQVAARDPLGNVYTSFTGSVTLALGTNPGGGALTGTTTRQAVAGVATFNDLSIDQPGSGYALVAVSAGMTPATSTAFDIVTAALRYLTGP